MSQRCAGISSERFRDVRRCPEENHGGTGQPVLPQRSGAGCCGWPQTAARLSARPIDRRRSLGTPGEAVPTPQTWLGAAASGAVHLPGWPMGYAGLAPVDPDRNRPGEVAKEHWAREAGNDGPGERGQQTGRDRVRLGNPVMAVAVPHQVAASRTAAPPIGSQRQDPASGPSPDRQPTEHGTNPSSQPTRTNEGRPDATHQARQAILAAATCKAVPR